MPQYALLQDNVVQQINDLQDELCLNQEGVVDVLVGLAYITALYNNEYEWVVSTSCTKSGDIYDRDQGTFTTPTPPAAPAGQTEPDYEVS